MMRFHCSSSQDTQRAGCQIGEYLSPWIGKHPLILLVSGEMGAGKTTVAKGLAQFLGVHQEVVSPSYVYAQEYPFLWHGESLPFLHIDLWRLGENSSLQNLGLDALEKKNGVGFVEWAQALSELPEVPQAKIWKLSITLEPDESREIVLEAV